MIHHAAPCPPSAEPLLRGVRRRGRGRAAVVTAVVTGGLALTLALASALPASAQDGDAAHGETLFYEHACYSCHGYEGVGRTPLDASRSGILASEEGFLFFLRLRAEQNPILPSTAMPNYPEESLSDADARDLYAYVVSVQAPSPAVDDIPALKAILEDASD